MGAAARLALLANFALGTAEIAPPAVVALSRGTVSALPAADERRLDGDNFLSPMLKGLASGDGLEMMSKASTEVIGAMVTSFLKNEPLTTEQRECLVQNSEKFVGKIMQVSSHIVMLMQEVMGQRTDPNMPGLADGSEVMKPLADFALKAGEDIEAAAPAAQPQEPAPAQPAKAPAPWADDGAITRDVNGRRLGALSGGTILLHLSSILMELGTSIQLLVKLGHNIADECIQGDVLNALEEAARHVRDLKYVAGHFLANGADVVEEFSHGVMAYKAGNYSQFGSQIGEGLRKILLSRNPAATLPEGNAGREMMVNISMGFVKGFFGKGFTLGITLDQDPQDQLRIDIESCVANNMAFFEEIWSALAYAYMSKDKWKQSRGAEATEEQQKAAEQGKEQVGTALAVAVMQLPDALHRCDIGASQADMLIDSIKAFGAGMHLTLSTPNELSSNEQITQDVGKTVKDWSKFDWYAFGYDLGHLLQELVLTLFPKKYSADDLGLRLRLDELGSEAASAAGVAGRNGILGRLVPALAIVVSTLVLAARRRVRSAGARSMASADTSDVELE